MIAIISISYASVDAYFHRYLIASDFYYVQGNWKKSGEIAQKGFQGIKNKSELQKFLYGNYTLYRKMQRAEKKEAAKK